MGSCVCAGEGVREGERELEGESGGEGEGETVVGGKVADVGLRERRRFGGGDGSCGRGWEKAP